ncbi:hypothetical protein [uncultured Algimonas sp.]|uniref:hypothetical protein n=1 Tax=uncultured Algimonas sp. TaxID=1547920 RepID=UPI00261DBCEA|nr:hypothetical protein [uncultured Algimonas sp.]
MTPNRIAPDEQTAYSAALPDNPTSDCADGSCAMPRSLSKELGDYAEGDYAVAAKTKDAPSMQDSQFNAIVRDGIA